MINRIDTGNKNNVSGVQIYISPKLAVNNKIYKTAFRFNEESTDIWKTVCYTDGHTIYTCTCQHIGFYYFIQYMENQLFRALKNALTQYVLQRDFHCLSINRVQCEFGVSKDFQNLYY